MAQDAKAKGKGKAKAKRPDAVGPAIGANVATPESNIKTLKEEGGRKRAGGDS